MRIAPLIPRARKVGISALSWANKPCFSKSASNSLISDSVRTMSSKLSGANRIKGTEKNIWVEFGKLAVENKALNLGQGFPDFKPPQHVIDEMMAAVASDNHLMHQYTRSSGHPRLVSALSRLYSPLIGQQLDPNKNVTVSVGAYGVLFCAVQGLINPGDEVVIIEPFFDCYEPMVKVAGGIAHYCPLRPMKTEGVTSSEDWILDPKELESKFNQNTKALIINNPNNPLGKVFSRDELQMMADLCKKYDTICLSDEVYEWMVYDDNKHIKIASLPGMFERTVTMGSAGKTLSATGWKLGWGIGPEHLIAPMQVLHQNCTYNCPTPVQEAVAGALEFEIDQMDQPDKCYFFSLAKELQPKRDKLAKICEEVGLSPVVPEGGYFMMVNTGNLKTDLPDDGTDDPRDFKFVRWMTTKLKLAAIPPSAFYHQEHKHLGENYVRFCFIKKDETIEAAGDILKKWFGSVKK